MTDSAAAVSREIFRQYDIRGIVGKDLTPVAAAGIGRAFAAYLLQAGKQGRVVVGRDNRPSGEMLRDALVEGLTTGGLDVVDISVVPTPVVYWSLHHLDVIGGIQITGSHNPPEYNGFKLCVGTRSLHGDAILALHDLLTSPPAARPGDVERADVLDRYVDDVVERTGSLGRPLRVVVDCGNGVGSVVARQLFDRLGVEATYLFCESDGTFPNHHPDPTVVENVQDLIRVVR